MLGWIILVTTLLFLLYVTTMSLKLNNSLTNSTLVTSVIAFQENSCVITWSKSDGFQHSFLNCVVDEWNGLPNHIRESNSIATFKRNVLSFIKDN